MISVIICSRTPDISDVLRQNITDTIGCAHEFVVIDNSRQQRSIFAAYNEGVNKAQGDILCFMHEDIRCHTKDWGTAVENRFRNDETLGLLGNLGSHFMPKCVCALGDSGLLSSNYYTKDKEDHYRESRYFDDSGAAEVVVVDGMWYCVRRQLFADRKIWYDESFEGFHYYDLDICMQVWEAGYKCIVVDDVEMEHYSEGDIDRTFLNNSFRFFDKWKDSLPMLKGIELTETEYYLSAKLSEISAYCRELSFYHRRYKNSFPQRVKRWTKKHVSKD